MPAIVVLLAIAAAAWVVSVARTAGMDAGPGTSPGSLASYAITWTVMMIAMMLPSAMRADRGAVRARRDERHLDAVLTAVIAAQKLLPWRTATIAAASALMLALGAGLAAAPAHVRRLAVPGTGAAMHGMRMPS